MVRREFRILANGVYLAAAWVSGDSYPDTRNSLSTRIRQRLVERIILVTIGFGYVGFRRQWIRATSGFRGATVDC